MTEKHTLGPWRVEEYDRDYIAQQGRLSAKHICIFATPFEVARTTGEDFDTREANARLIAAAPAMLEDLKLILFAAEEPSKLANNDAGPRYQDMLRSLAAIHLTAVQAIAKATE